jgi:hypothetical protein
MKWKYQVEKQKPFYDLYLRLKTGSWKSLKIRGWKFEKMANGSLFKTEVIEEDGKPADKFWSVWDYDLTEALKKKLKGKKPDKAIVELRVKKSEDEGDESFELE